MLSVILPATYGHENDDVRTNYLSRRGSWTSGSTSVPVTLHWYVDNKWGCTWDDIHSILMTSKTFAATNWRGIKCTRPPGGEYWRHKDLTPLVGTVSRWKVVRPWNTRQDAYLVAFYLLNDCIFWNYLGSAEQMELFESTSCQLLIGKNSMCTQPCHAAELLNKVKFNQLNRPVTELECFLSQMSATRYLYCWNSIQRSFL